jgi:hypothetical protein
LLLKVDMHARLLRKVFELPEQCGQETKAIQSRWTQVQGEITHALERVGDRDAHVVELGHILRCTL